MENIKKNTYTQTKKERRETKRSQKRLATGEEVIFIFEKILEGWKTIKIYNTIIQNNPNSNITKKQTEVIATGNCKLYESELPKERYKYYETLRNQIYLSKQKTNIA